MGKSKWEDVCRDEFVFTADHLIHRNHGKGVTAVLKKLARESHIPFNTLRRWYYKNRQAPQKSVDVDTTSVQPIADVKQNNQVIAQPKTPHIQVITPVPIRPNCIICGNPAEPYSKAANTQYRKYCASCRKGGDYEYVCHECGSVLIIKKKNLKPIKGKGVK